jgi:hypothetical protein
MATDTQRGGVRALAAALLLLLLGAGACHSGQQPAAWQSLFDGRDLGHWVATGFGGEGEVAVRDGRLHCGQGYELELTARRELGADFFCGLTFPVGADHLTLVLGGWGGSLCGLSNLDGLDASRNATRTLRHFATGQDHRVAVRVRTDRIEVHVADALLFAIDPRRHRLALRPEVELCRPLGLCCYNTAASFAGVRWRPLAP